jgi:hypothetical protein
VFVQMQILLDRIALASDVGEDALAAITDTKKWLCVQQTRENEKMVSYYPLLPVNCHVLRSLQTRHSLIIRYCL